MEEILAEQESYYKNLYMSKTDVNSELSVDHKEYFLSDRNIPKLNENDKIACDLEITMEDCLKAVNELPTSKSPGADGFTTNFYKFFWQDLKELLFECFKANFENETLSQYQRIGILNLLPKKDKDLRYLANWRPISLLNTDYKILTKILASRLQKVITNIVNMDQVGYIKGRYIGENIRTLYDIVTYCDLNEIEAYIIQVDFEKAFDSIEWNFLFDTLDAFNFGPYFKKWIKILYTNITACVGNNGHYSKYFKLSRSIRQGCPISALLFLLVVEILAIKLRSDTQVKGLKISNLEYKILMMADDMTLALTDINSIDKAITNFNKFHKISGLKLNLNKTEIIPIGKLAGTIPILPNHLSQIKVKNGPFKALGVWYTLNEIEQISLNFDDRIKSMKSLITIWKPRNLSLKGKILIIKTLILPQIQFLFNMVTVTHAILKKVDEMFFAFLWNNKTHKIKRATIIAPIEHGGLGMIDIFAVNTASKISWIRKLFDENDAKWKILFMEMLNIDINLLKYNLNATFADKCKTSFHKQIISAWIDIHSTYPKSQKEITSQYILHNRFILVNKEAIEEKFFGNQHNYFTRNLKVSDILHEGRFKSLIDLNEHHNLTINMLAYNSIISAIPKEWKKKILNVQNIEIEIINDSIPSFFIRNTHKPIITLKNKDFYTTLIMEKTMPPSSINKWIDTYPFLEKYNWSDIYKLTNRYISEPYFQSFQYKIINRILNTNEKLFTWNLKNSNKCTFCNNIDTIEHHLYYCRASGHMWDCLQKWINTNLRINFKLTVCEVLFGLPYIANDNTEILNLLIIMTKWYINRSKCRDKPPNFIELLTLIKNKIYLIAITNTLNGRINKDWQETLYNIFLNL